MKLNKNKVGMVLALFFALWALIWDIVMAIGLGQWLLNVKLRMIFLPVDALKLTPFRLDKALLLIVLAYIGGYIIGWIFSWIWNWANKNEH